jgi:hypothetical protein
MRFRPARAVRSRDTPDQAPAPGTTLRTNFLLRAGRFLRGRDDGAAGDEYTHQRKLRSLGERAMARKLARMRSFDPLPCWLALAVIRAPRAALADALRHQSGALAVDTVRQRSRESVGLGVRSAMAECSVTEQGRSAWRIVDTSGHISGPIAGVRGGWRRRGRAGCLNVAIDPSFASNRTIYLSFAQPDRTGPRGRLSCAPSFAIRRSTACGDLPQCRR